MKNYKDFVVEAGRCWKGYKPAPGKKPYSPDSCVKEGVELNETKDFSKYVIKPTKTEPKIVRKTNPAGRTTDHVEYEVHGTLSSHKKTFKTKKEAEEYFNTVKEETVVEAAVDAKGLKSSTGGLTQKGRDYYNRKDGGNLKAPVTTPPSKLTPGSKAANRRKSFCARMGGVEGPMKKPNGEPTRKALALRKWNC
jgi:uncharacterized membrane protein